MRNLGHAMAAHVRAGVLVTAGTGLRQGELFGLTLDRVDFLRRELRVDRQLYTPDRGRPFLKKPKSKNSYRVVSLSAVVVDVLSAHVATYGSGEDGLIFHSRGRAIGRAMAATHFRSAAASAGVDATWHDLRHHHATSLLSEGINPAKVAERLGHDLKTLLKTYAHLMPRDDERGRAVVDATLGGSAEDWLAASA